MQNLRRVAGYDVQYFATVEPQKRLAPPLHMAIRGTLPRAELRQISGAASAPRPVHQPEPTALVFTGANSGILRRSNFRRAVKWSETTRKLGVPGLHFHDLRHTGNSIAASAGASLRDLTARMGDDSVHAAMIYQHRTVEADHKIADVMNGKITQVLPTEASGH
ncbi:hypothetical protein GCM10009530_12010 [Microbispora corallina]|uniref:Tyr recombinase domain-containing protein n=1 Tax=Microbispora corallina TaxID=83302 RepID=A0ABQ4FTN2_9ACTN|nr:hypothetical protein Mco01_11020 [Microbispora corallina]